MSRASQDLKPTFLCSLREDLPLAYKACVGFPRFLTCYTHTHTHVGTYRRAVPLLQCCQKEKCVHICVNVHFLFLFLPGNSGASLAEGLWVLFSPTEDPSLFPDLRELP